MNDYIVSQDDSAKQSELYPEIAGLGYVYLVGVKGHKVYKIGHSTQPHKRFKTLQARISVELELIVALPYEDYQQAEYRWQSWYSAFKLSGEWFALPDEEVEFFKRYVS